MRAPRPETGGPVAVGLGSGLDPVRTSFMAGIQGAHRTGHLFTRRSCSWRRRGRSRVTPPSVESLADGSIQSVARPIAPSTVDRKSSGGDRAAYESRARRHGLTPLLCNRFLRLPPLNLSSPNGPKLWSSLCVRVSLSFPLFCFSLSVSASLSNSLCVSVLSLSSSILRKMLKRVFPLSSSLPVGSRMGGGREGKQEDMGIKCTAQQPHSAFEFVGLNHSSIVFPAPTLLVPPMLPLAPFKGPTSSPYIRLSLPCSFALCAGVVLGFVDPDVDAVRERRWRVLEFELIPGIRWRRRGGAAVGGTGEASDVQPRAEGVAARFCGWLLRD